MSDTHREFPRPTLADLQRCGVDDLLAQPTPTDSYLDMQARLFRAAETAQAAGDASTFGALRLFAQICSMMLVPDECADPIKALMTTPSGGSMILEDLTAADVDVLADLAPALNHPLLRARVADLVWLKARRKGVVFPRMVIEGYRHPPIDGAEFENEALTCRQRAVQNARSTGKSGDAQVAEIEAELLAAFWRAVDASDHTGALRLLRPLQMEGLARDEAEKIGAVLEAIARAQYAQGAAFGSQQFADHAQAWFARARNDEAVAAMRVLAAESWVAQADADRSGLSRENCYRKAIDVYQRIPPATESCTACRRPLPG